MKSWEHSGFNVFVGKPVDTTDSEQLLFLSRYLKRNVIALERLFILEQKREQECSQKQELEREQEPIVRIVKSLDESHIFQDFSPLDFLAQMSLHIPDTWEQTTRYFGIYSARTRGAQKELEHVQEHEHEQQQENSAASIYTGSTDAASSNL